MLTGQIDMRGRETGQRRGEGQARFLIQVKSLQGWLQLGPTAKLRSVCYKTRRLGSHSPPGTCWALAAPSGVNFLALPTLHKQAPGSGEQSSKEEKLVAIGSRNSPKPGGKRRCAGRGLRGSIWAEYNVHSGY